MQKEDKKVKSPTLFKPGVVANPNGRPKGVPNKMTTQMRQTFTDLFENNKDKMQADLDAVEPKDRLQFWVAMAPYFMPKLTAIKAEISTKQTGHEDALTSDLIELIIKHAPIEDEPRD